MTRSNRHRRQAIEVGARRGDGRDVQRRHRDGRDMKRRKGQAVICALTRSMTRARTSICPLIEILFEFGNFVNLHQSKSTDVQSKVASSEQMQRLSCPVSSQAFCALGLFHQQQLSHFFSRSESQRMSGAATLFLQASSSIKQERQEQLSTLLVFATKQKRSALWWCRHFIDVSLPSSSLMSDLILS